MTDNTPGNPNAGGGDHVPDEYEQTCPACGATVGQLPQHIRHKCPVTGGSE